MRAKNLWLVLLAIVVFAVGILVYSRKAGVPIPELVRESSPSPLVSIAPSQDLLTPTPAPTPAVTPVIRSLRRKSAPSSRGETYTTLVKKYAGRRIQFDIACQAIPSFTTFKNNTAVMFDNRSGDARWIGFEGKSYNFPGYGYRIFTLSANTLPHTIHIDCGAGKNVGQILLQR